MQHTYSVQRYKIRDYEAIDRNGGRREMCVEPFYILWNIKSDLATSQPPPQSALVHDAYRHRTNTHSRSTAYRKSNKLAMKRVPYLASRRLQWRERHIASDVTGSRHRVWAV